MKEFSVIHFQSVRKHRNIAVVCGPRFPLEDYWYILSLSWHMESDVSDQHRSLSPGRNESHNRIPLTTHNIHTYHVLTTLWRRQQIVAVVSIPWLQRQIATVVSIPWRQRQIVTVASVVECSLHHNCVIWLLVRPVFWRPVHGNHLGKCTITHTWVSA